MKFLWKIVIAAILIAQIVCQSTIKTNQGVQAASDVMDKLKSLGGGALPKNGSRQVGGKEEIDVNDPYVQELLKVHLMKLATDEGSFEVTEVKKITRQVVAGFNYEVTGKFKVGNSGIKDCVVSFWVREWLEEPDKVQVSASCQDGSEFTHPKPANSPSDDDEYNTEE